MKPLDVLAEEIGVKIEDLVKLDANENLYGPVEEVRKAARQRAAAPAPRAATSPLCGTRISVAHVHDSPFLLQIRKAIAECDVYHIYPDPSQVYLRRDIAKFLGEGIKPEHVCAGTGSDELIDLVFTLFDPKAVVNLPPTFGMYPFLSKIRKTAVVTVDRLPAPAFALDMPAITEAVAMGGGVVFIASPNNPTGGMLTHAEVEQLCKLNAIIVCDEAYAEFAAPGASAASLVHRYDNLIVLRTFSKWAGLAGVRVGYGVAHPEIITAMMAIKQPYNVNVAADYGARAALAASEKIMTTQVQPMLYERDRMTTELAALGWMHPVPTSSNFVLFEVSKPFVASEIVAALRKRGILVRYYPNGRLAGYIRISAGRPQDTDRILAAMVAIGKEQEAAHGKPLPITNPSVLLLDMDGVLVEVSGSYRAAIVATAAHFGVTVTQADIDAVKAAGGANNDWVVTQRLIAAKGNGKEVDIASVTAAFERLYQGDKATGDAGLKAKEYSLVTADYLRELKAKAPGGIAVVTGRPRADAAEAIARYGWQGIFDTVVCMEDGKLKPDPEPVQIALERLRTAYVAKKIAASSAASSTASASSGAAAMPGHSDSVVVASAIAEAASLITASRAIMVGDTVDDIRSARAAGAYGIGAFPPDKAPSASAEKAAKLKASLTEAGALDVLLPGFAALGSLLSVREDAAAIQKANLERVRGMGKASGGAKTVGTGAGRTGTCSRKTKETSIYAWVNLDGTGESEINTG